MDKPTPARGRPASTNKRTTATPKTRKKPAATRARATAKPAATRARATAKPAAATRKKPAARINLDDPELYLNRELTWLEFNYRVLDMAADDATPLLERVKFLAIVSSNLDEFFMKRIGGLKQQIAAGIRTPSVDGRTPLQQLRESQVIVRDIPREQNRIYRQLHDLLEARDIRPCR